MSVRVARALREVPTSARRDPEREQRKKAMATIPKRRHGRANSGSSETVRLQLQQKFRRTRIVPSNAISTSVRV
jgi:hypothetical protein